MPHLPPTHALRVEVGGKSVTYGADCRPNDALPELAQGTDILVVECTFGDGDIPEGAMHMNARAVGEMAAAARPGQVLLVHGDPAVDRDASVDIVRQAYDGPVEWARERHIYTA